MPSLGAVPTCLQVQSSRQLERRLHLSKQKGLLLNPREYPVDQSGNAQSESDEAADLQIIASVCSGHVNDYAQLIERHKQYVVKIVAKHVPRNMVEEVAHDVFVSAYSSLPTYSRKRPFRHWLGALAVRRSYDYWRKAYRSKEVPASQLSRDNERWLEQASAGDAQVQINSSEQLREGREVLRIALAKLSPEDRMLVSLVYFDGYSTNETAELLGWTVVNVKVRLFRVRSKLRRVIEALLVSEGQAHDSGK
jgi:RNA polymerase sigma-70 factor, ECF subfamily